MFKTKSFRTIITSLLAVVLVLTMAVPAFAAGTGTGTITINKTVPGKVYQLYRIFDLDYKESTESGGDTLYSYTMNTDFTNFFNTEYSITKDAEAVKIISDMNSTQFEAFAQKAKAYALVNNISPDADVAAVAATTIVTDKAYGYYLLYPQGGLSGICSLTTSDPNAEVDVKDKYPTIDKQIIENGNPVQSSSAKVGDDIPYQLTAQVPDMTGYNSYTFIVTDVMSKGLTFNDDVVIRVGGDTLTVPADYSVVSAVDGASGKTTITISFEDFYDNYKDRAGDAITVTYSAKINSEAVIGPGGNNNDVKIEYSNDPKTQQTDKTPDENAKVYIFDLQIEKVDAGDYDTKLPGVTFSLWTTTPNSETSKVYDDNGTPLTLYPISEGLTTDNTGKVSQTIPVGKYYLFEDTTPDGYNDLADPIIFTVTTVIDPVTHELINWDIDNADLVKHNDTGIIEAVIENSSGLELPSTGGIGTTIFLIAGILIMVAAIICFAIYVKKSMALKFH